MFGKKKETADDSTKKDASQASAAKASDAANSAPATDKPLSLKEQQEQKRQAYIAKKEAAKQKLLEQQKIKAEKEKARQAELKKKQKIAMITFSAGLFVMLTTLIALFPSPAMIVFSTLLMFTFFFLGIAYQRLVMQLLVIAMACVLITGAFYMIMTSV